MRSPLPTRRTLLAAALVAAAVLAPARAHANGRFPAANQIVVSPDDPKVMLLRTTFGVLVTHDGGGNWDWICESAVGNANSEDPTLGLMTGGAIIASELAGLARSADTGCAWSYATGAIEKKAIVDLAVRPSAPASAVAVTTKFRGTSDAGAQLYDSQVFATTDSGATWNALGVPIDPTGVLETIEVAPSDAHRLYVSGRVGASGSPAGVVWVSSDDGATWDARAVPFEGSERAPFVAAVDPKNADRIYVRVAAPTTSRLLVSDDAGKTYRVAYSGGLLFGFALSRDGEKIYIGGPTDGLLVANKNDLAFAVRSKIAVQCLATSGATLLACSNEVSGFVVGASTDDGASWSALLHLASIRGPLACPPSSTAAACVDQWPALRDQLAIDAPLADAGTTTTTPKSTTSSCGCTLVGRGGHDALALAIAAASMSRLALRSRRRARRQRVPRARDPR